MPDEKTFQVWPGFIFWRIPDLASKRERALRGYAILRKPPLLQKYPVAPRHGTVQISSEAYRKQENRIRSRSKIDPISTLKIRHFEPWRERARATKLFRDSLGGPRLDRVIGLKQHIRFDEQAVVSQFIANKIDFQGSELRSAYAAEVANSIGSTIEGSSFSGLLTRVEIGHIRMASAGKGRINSCGSGSSLSQRA